MQIVVNDTNLFIDLIHAELIEQFFQLPFEVHTTDFVVGEIEEPDQEEIINELVGSLSPPNHRNYFLYWIRTIRQLADYPAKVMLYGFVLCPIKLRIKALP